jgi:hypothetical protein
MPNIVEIADKLNESANGNDRAPAISRALVDEHLSHGDDAPCIQIRKLVSGLSPAKRLERYLVLFQMFLDESGYGQTAMDEAFIFAGFIGGVPQWEDLAHQWDTLLNESPVLSAEGFKKSLRCTRNSKRIEKFVAALANSKLHRINICIPRRI